MHAPDESEESEAFPNVKRTDEQDITDEHVLDLLVALGRPAEEQDRSGGRHHITNSDNRFLRNLAGTFAGNGKKRGAEQGETERDGKGGPALQIQMEEDRNANA